MLVAALALVPVVAFAFAPDPPTSLNAVPGAQPVIARLTWNPSSGAVRYAVSVATTASGPFRMVGETQVTSYDFKDGLGGVPYYFRVAALNEQGEQSSPAPQPTGPVTSAWVSDAARGGHLQDQQVRELSRPPPGARRAAHAHRGHDRTHLGSPQPA